MVKIAILILLILHGLIHLLGFVKAFELMKVDQLKRQISKTAGIFWLLSVFLFLVTAVLLYFGDESWRMVAGVAVIISQLLIMLSWSDAKYGTIANGVVAVVILLGSGNQISEKYGNGDLSQRQFTAYLDRQIPILMSDYSIPGLSILIIKDGKKQFKGVRLVTRINPENLLDVSASSRRYFSCFCQPGLYDFTYALLLIGWPVFISNR